MKSLVINKTTNTPRVVFNPEQDIYEIKGNSYPENTAQTYEPVINWIDSELQKIKNEVVFKFRIEYLNTASSKMMSTIFSHIEFIMKIKSNIRIEWFYDQDDEDIIPEVETYSSFNKIPVEFIPFDRRGKKYF